MANEHNGQASVELEVMAKEYQAVAITDGVKMELIRDLAPVADRMHGYTQFAAIVNITSQEDADRAAGVVAEIDKDLKLVKSHDVLTKITDGLFKLHRRATAFRALFVDPMERDRKKIRQPVLDWEAAEKAKAAVIQAKLQAEADAKAQREREKQEAEARRQRQIEDDARRKAEDARRAAAAAEGAEKTRLVAAANAADRAANAAQVKAEAKIEASAAIIPPTIHINAPKSGLRTAKAWKVKSVNEEIFFAAIAARPDLWSFADINTTRLERGKAANPSMTVPGIEFHQITR